MDNINRSTLNNALQWITQLERMAVNSTNADPAAEIFSSSSAGSASSVNNFPSQRNQSSHTQPYVSRYPSTQTITTANKNTAASQAFEDQQVAHCPLKADECRQERRRNRVEAVAERLQVQSQYSGI